METKEFKLPKTVTATVWIVLYIDPKSSMFGHLTIWEMKPTIPDVIAIAEHEITLDVPQLDVEGLRERAVKSLKDVKEEILAKAHKEAKDVQDKIDALLQITYQGENNDKL